MPSTKVSQIKDKLNIINKYIENPSRLYTGLEAKKYWKNNIFEPDIENVNNAIKSGRWSAYAHYTLFNSFKNILKKHNLNKNSQVWIHPLTDQGIVQEVIDQGHQITSIDIKKETLQFDPKVFIDWLEHATANNSLPELIIITSFCGLGKEIEECLVYAKKLEIPVCLIFNEGIITKAILELITALKWGSVIVSTDHEPFTDQMYEAIVNTELTDEDKKNIKHFEYLKSFLAGNKQFYLSFFIENRATAILEYHLEESKNNFIDILNVYNYLLTKSKANKTTFISNVLNSVLSFSDGKIKLGNLFKNNIYKNNVEAINDLVAKLPAYLNSAIPDSVFEISNLTKKVYPDNYLNEKSSDLQQNTKNIHTFFSRQVAKRPEGTLEIPTFYFNRVYVKYFCYTTEGEYWNSILSSRGLYVKSGFTLHPLFVDKDYLMNANFVAKFGLIV